MIVKLNRSFSKIDCSVNNAILFFENISFVEKKLCPSLDGEPRFVWRPKYKRTLLCLYYVTPSKFEVNRSRVSETEKTL